MGLTPFDNPSRCVTKVFPLLPHPAITILYLRHLYANASNPSSLPPPLYRHRLFAEGTAFLCPSRWPRDPRMRALGHLTRIPSFRASLTPVSTRRCSDTLIIRSLRRRPIITRIPNLSRLRRPFSTSNSRGIIPSTKAHSSLFGTSMLVHFIREEGGSVR